MTGVRKTFGGILLAAFAFLAAMSGAASASPFTEALTKDYFDLARLQFYYADDPFAEKARAADQGKVVLPWDPAKHKIPAEDRPDLVKAHERLMAALNNGFREQNPKQASAAQTNFDCWLKHVVDAKGKDWKCIKVCRDDFEKAMAAWKPPVAAVVAPKPKPAPQPKPAPAPVPRSFIVFFDWDSSVIKPDAQRVLRAAVGHAREVGATTINLEGHADRSGPTNYNQGLSLRRASAVREALVSMGMSASNISLVARGESDPLVRTADGVREPRNRRVEIRF